MHVQPVNGEFRGGGSSWQSLARGTRSIETDYLNGEIVHARPAPRRADPGQRADAARRQRAGPHRRAAPVGAGRHPARPTRQPDEPDAPLPPAPEFSIKPAAARYWQTKQPAAVCTRNAPSVAIVSAHPPFELVGQRAELVVGVAARPTRPCCARSSSTGSTSATTSSLTKGCAVTDANAASSSAAPLSIVNAHRRPGREPAMPTAVARTRRASGRAPRMRVGVGHDERDTARAEHPPQLGDRRGPIGHVVQHVHREHDVEATRRRTAAPARRSRAAGRRRPRPRAAQHPVRQIGAAHEAPMAARVQRAEIPPLPHPMSSTVSSPRSSARSSEPPCRSSCGRWYA